MVLRLLIHIPSKRIVSYLASTTVYSTVELLATILHFGGGNWMWLPLRLPCENTDPSIGVIVFFATQLSRKYHQDVETRFDTGGAMIDYCNVRGFSTEGL